MHLHTDAMTKAMPELVAESGGGDVVAGQCIQLVRLHPGTHPGQGSLLGVSYDVVDRPEPVVRFTKEDRARQIPVVAADVGTHVDDDRPALAQQVVAGAVVGQRCIGPSRDDDRERWAFRAAFTQCLLQHPGSLPLGVAGTQLGQDCVHHLIGQVDRPAHRVQFGGVLQHPQPFDHPCGGMQFEASGQPLRQCCVAGVGEVVSLEPALVESQPPGELHQPVRNLLARFHQLTDRESRRFVACLQNVATVGQDEGLRWCDQHRPVAAGEPAQIGDVDR